MSGIGDFFKSGAEALVDLAVEAEPMIYEVVIGTRGPHTPRREVTLEDLEKFGQFVIVAGETPVEDLNPDLRTMLQEPQ